ncbi:MAG: PorV/PorQ family protein [Bacteroidales bacterium]|nr:PorV/PorQ family protein [Bacteroidales bacterium]MCF8458136.1 PorV/PorQ family protein [Bacteroidales bacterium]
MNGSKLSSTFYIIFFILVNYSSTVFAQKNIITTAVPFMLYDGDARIAGFGSIGTVSNEKYADAGTWSNPALLSRRKESVGVNITFNPWKNKNLNANNKLYTLDGSIIYSIDKSNSLSLHGKYFHYGEMTIGDIYGSVTGTLNPYEYSTKLTYAHHFKNGFSVGARASFIFSDLWGDQIIYGTTESHPGKSIAIGLGWNYDNSFVYRDQVDCSWSIGGSLSNMGSKISYSDNADKDFIPANLSIAGIITPSFKLSKSVTLQIDLAYEVNKLLVPTPPHYKDTTPGIDIIIAGKDPDVSSLQSYFQSFYDAPDGFQEELHEISHKLGFEARFILLDQMAISLRQGIFRQHETKGDRKYRTSGIGLEFRGLTLNWAKYHYFKESNWELSFVQLGYIQTIK